MNTKDAREKKNFSDNFAPLSSKGWPKWTVYLLSFLGFIYLLNPTAGIIEILPDTLPLVGNIDEGAAALALWYGFLEIQKARKKE
jgi:hypothetical protein